MKILTTIALAVIGVLALASKYDARIGSTLEQCRERYGKEVKIDIPPAGTFEEIVEFRVRNFFIGVHFLGTASSLHLLP